MSKFCEKCLKYEVALERIACLDDTSMWPGGLTIQRIAREALGTPAKYVLTDDDRKAIKATQEYLDAKDSIEPYKMA